MFFFKNKDFLTGVASISGASVSNAILSFFISVIAARVLTQSDFGVLSIIMATGAFLALGIDFGANTVLANRVAIRPLTRLYGAIMSTRVIMAGLFTILALTTLALALMFDFILHDQFWNWILVLCSTFWLVVLSTEQALAQGLKKYWVMALIISSVNMIRFPLTILAAKLNANLNQFVVVYTIPAIILGLILTWLKRNNLSFKKDSVRLIKRILPTIGWAGITVCLSAALFRVDLWIVSIMAGMSEAGKFAAAFQVASLVFIIGSSVSSVFLPEIARLDRDNHTHKFLLFYLKRASPFAFIAILFALVLANSTPWIFGEKYKSTEMTTFLLTTSFILSVLNSPFYLLQQSRRRYNFLAKVHLVQISVLILGCVILIPYLGGKGAAAANLLMRVFSFTFFMFISLYKTSSIPFTSESISKRVKV